jgi:hypothetical protein
VTPPAERPTPDARAALALSGLGALVLLFAAWRARLPQPYVDDPFWIGGALGLLETGELRNAYAGTWLRTFGTELNLVYPPLFSYVLAGWLSVFGISAASIAWFSRLWIALACAGFAAVLRRFGVPSFVWIGATALWLVLLAPTLRPEPVAYGLALWAVARVPARPGPAAAAVATLAIGAGALAYPMAGIVCGGFAAAFVWREHRRAPFSAAELWGVAAGVAGGAALVLGLLARMLDGALAEFVRVFLLNYELHARSPLDAPRQLLRAATQYREWLLTAPLLLGLPTAVLCARVYRDRVGPEARAFAASCLAISGAAHFAYVANGIGVARVLSFAGVLVLLDAFRNGRRQTPLALLGLILMLGVPSHAWLPWALQAPPPPPESAAACRRALEQISRGRRLLVDGAVARDAFDYRLPANATSLLYDRPAPGHDATIGGLAPLRFADLREDEVWAGARYALAKYPAGTEGLPEAIDAYPRLRLGAHAFESLSREPFRLVYVDGGRRDVVECPPR